MSYGCGGNQPWQQGLQPPDVARGQCMWECTVQAYGEDLQCKGQIPREKSLGPLRRLYTVSL